MIKKILFLICLFLFFLFPLFAFAASLEVSAEVGEKEIKLSWEEVAQASHYKVYRNNENISDKITTTSYIDSEVTEGEQYTYHVRAYKSEDEVISWGGVMASLKTQAAPAPATDTTFEGTKGEVGAPFPGEPKEVTLFEHIAYVHKWASLIGSFMAILMIIFAGFKYTTSLGNPEALQDAKDTIVGALVGLVIILLSYILLQIFGAQVEPLPEGWK